MMIIVYAKEYLITPTKEDIISVVVFYRAKSKENGYLGCLDCTHA
jgi:hypothetical protein